ncbi:MAG TPA: mechanosensitive ion channel domain-containing protein [Flavobacteriales bacterium]
MDTNVQSFLQTFISHIKTLAAQYVPKLAAAIAVLIIGLWLANRIKAMIGRSMKRRELDPSLQSFIPSLVTAILKVLVFVTVAGMVGIQTTSFIAVLGAAGLAVGMALQGSLSNFAGGVLILIFKPFRVGDTITAQGESGTVKEIQIFHTIILSGDNRTIIIPNGALSNGIIENKTRQGSERFDLTITLDGGTNLEKAEQLIKEALNEVNGILKTPAPGVSVVAFHNDDVEFLVQPFVESGKVGPNRTALIRTIKQKFEQNNISFARTNVFVKNVN